MRREAIKGSESSADENARIDSTEHVSLCGVTKRFGPVTAVEKAHLSIEEGEFFALLGPSGCGKTTTLRLIAGLETPTEGKITIGGRDMTRVHPRDRDIGMVFQDYALYPHMSLLENIGYPLKVRKVPKEQMLSRVREVAEHLQISSLLDRRPAEVSGGQQQRAAVARALVHKPQVFLFDEPLSNLDAKLRLEARAFLKHLQAEVAVTAIYVTHDQAEAMSMADRLAVMHSGRINQVGEPRDVYQDPKLTVVASFVGNPPMNLLPCQLVHEEDSDLLVGEGFRLSIDCMNVELPRDRIIGEKLMLGIRPEHIDICEENPADGICGDLFAIQPLGAEVLVSLRVGETNMSIRLFTDEPPTLPEKVWFRPTLEKMHIYYADGECLV